MYLYLYGKCFNNFYNICFKWYFRYKDGNREFIYKIKINVLELLNRLLK